jgi:hypothetical protein
VNARSSDQSKPQVEKIGLGITKVMETRMYPDVHFLGGKLVSVREVDVTTKAHQRHEGSPYSP